MTLPLFPTLTPRPAVTVPKPSDAELLADPWAFGPWCLVVGEVRALPPHLHLPVRGMLGRFPLPDPVVRVLQLEFGIAIDRGFSLQQPYASAIVSGPKRIENRPTPWNVPEGGIWVGVHAGLQFYGGKERATELVAEWHEDGGEWPEAPRLFELPRGCLIGAMRIDHCVPFPGAHVATRKGERVDLKPPTRRSFSEWDVDVEPDEI